MAPRSLLPEGGRVIAVVVGVETYLKSRFEPVQHAEGDARDFAELLGEMYGADSVDCELLLSHEASKTNLDFQIHQAIRSATEDDLFIFFYAGHGFFGAGDNYLTAYDTAPTNVIEASVPVASTLLQPLYEGKCQRALMFIDACATRVRTRAPIASFDESQLPLPPGTQDQYHAVFLSSQRGQSSHSAPALRHGIWTYHLLQALRGDAGEAIVEDCFVTDVSLRDYLREAVPRYIRAHTKISGRQIPEAIIRASSTFAIRSIPKRAILVDEDDLSLLSAPARDAYFEGIQEGAVRRLPGFKKGHRAPERVSSATARFVKQAAWPIIEEDIKDVYSKAKPIFGLRYKDLSRETSEEDASGSLDCEYFRYSIEAEQHPEEADEYRVTRQLILRETGETVVQGTHRIFGTRLNKLIIEVDNRKWDYGDLVSGFEDIKDDLGGELEEDEDDQLISYTAPDGLQLEIDVGNGQIRLSAGDNTIPTLLKRAREIRFGLSGSNLLALR